MALGEGRRRWVEEWSIFYGLALKVCLSSYLIIIIWYVIELEECNCNAKPLLSNWPNTCHFLHETEKNTLPTTQAHKIEDERKSLKIVPRSLIGRKRTESVQSCKILSACSREFFSEHPFEIGFEFRRTFTVKTISRASEKWGTCDIRNNFASHRFHWSVLQDERQQRSWSIAFQPKAVF